MDDDVQYLGTKLAAPHDDPCQPHPSLMGIVLHVDKCGDKPAHDLTFYRARSGYVNIGRKSGSDDRSMRRENDDHNAVFTCQVVSARHAKLVLSDSGQVYIVDLHSRHGTHLSRRGEVALRTLQPEVETLLADGDVLTFGKAVGAGSYHVSPVTVRVELLTAFSASEPSADCILISSRPSSPTLETRPRRLSSGRYGLISASIIESDSPHSSCSISVSSDVASSPSELDSDVEDEHVCVAPLFRDSQGKTLVKIPAFRSFIREMCHSTALPSPAISDVVPDGALEDAPDSPPAVDIVTNPSPIIVSEPFPKSRPHSPIDLVTSPPSEVQQSDPAVIGAWPSSRPTSPRHPSLGVEEGHLEVPLAPEPDREPIPVPPQPSHCHRTTPLYSTNQLHQDLVQCLSTQSPFFPASGPFNSSITSDFGLSSVPPPPPPLPLPQHRMPPFHSFDKVVAERVSSEIKGSLKNVEDRILTLQETVSDIKSRQTVTEEDVVDLQGHVDMLEPDSERLLCRITGAERNIATLSMLQGQMTTLQNQVTTLRAKMDTPDPRAIENPMDDVKACAAALNGLVSEMKALREDVEKRIEAKMEAIQCARSEALDALKGVVVEAESMMSAKRKRDDDEAPEEAPEAIAAREPSPFTLSRVDDIPLTEAPRVSITQDAPSIPDPAIVVPAIETNRPKKRVRTAMYTVAQTAAAMAIGAAATWSALAFS